MDKQTVIVNTIGARVTGVVRTDWQEPGSWWDAERGQRYYGTLPFEKFRYMDWDSVVAAQTFADEIGADFQNLAIA